ncbi:MAG TPA: GatB/YqeY domain-containing protein [Candidatus Baltobacteraceae bacterium]|nr:GatB/YqeY domain-containing protein [Candidatus Baltobacteraceae bacterium]
MAALKDRFAADLKEAMKARDQLRVDTLRSALSGFTYKRTEAGVELSESDELDVVRKQVKQRNDSAAEFEKAGRAELADKEKRERDILLAYLPAQKSADEVRSVVKAIITELPGETRNQGSVMKLAMAQLKGVADGNLVRQIVTEELSA